MDPREELMALRRMAELEAKATAQPSSGIPVGRGVSQIPTEPGANLAPTPQQPVSILDRIRGAAEIIPTMAGGAIGGVVSPIVGMGATLASGKYGTPEGIRIGEEMAKRVQGQFYQPRTEQGQQYTEAISNAMAPIIGVPIPTLNALSRSISPAARAIGDVGRTEGLLIKGAVAAPLEARAARIQQEKIAQSYANAPMIEAMQSVQRIGGAVPPAISNPTTANVIKGKLAGSAAIEEKMAKVNETQVTNKVREDLGVAPTTRLDDKAINSALDVAGKPYDVVKNIPVLTPNPEIIAGLESLKKPVTAVSKGKIEAVNTLIDDMMEELKQGRSGTDVLNDIRQLRKEANNVYKRNDKGNATAIEVADAETRKNIANVYEQLIDSNVTDPSVLANIQAARTKQAQIYQHARALDYAKQKIDPQAYVKMYEESQGNITGLSADIAKAASNFPSVFTLTPAEVKGFPRLSRSGVGGALGGALGVPLGPVGILTGTSAGIAAGSTLGAIAAKRMATPAYQAAHAIPADYRPTNNLRPNASEIQNALAK